MGIEKAGESETVAGQSKTLTVTRPDADALKEVEELEEMVTVNEDAKMERTDDKAEVNKYSERENQTQTLRYPIFLTYLYMLSVRPFIL